MITKIITRVIFPSLLLGGWIYYTVYYNQIFSSFWISFFLILLSLICAVSIFIFITGLFFSDFFDFKFWSISSYKRLIKEDLWKSWLKYKSGNIIRVFYYLFIPVFIYTMLVGWTILNKKNIDFELSKYGIITSGYITHYDVAITDNVKKRFIAVEYSIKNGVKIYRYVRVANKYAIMDSVKIMYSSKRPSIYKVIEQKQ